MNTKNNKRRQASQEKIEKAFLELLQTKELSAITVSEIIKKTKLNRSTFYANYADLYALADAIREKLETDVAQLYKDDRDNKVNSNDYLRLFYHIQSNQLFYKTYFLSLIHIYPTAITGTTTPHTRPMLRMPPSSTQPLSTMRQSPTRYASAPVEA